MPNPRRRYRQFALMAFAALITGLAVVLHRALWANTAQLDGHAVVGTLQASVEIVRDAAGVATILANSERDAAAGLGFVHAQERFFEMDLARRAAAGEISALVGSAALPIDRARRAHRFRHRMSKALSEIPERERKLLQSYADGVNAGLDALRSKPFAYWLLRQAPLPWRPEDSLLVIVAMFFDLQRGDNAFELERLQLSAALPERVYSWLTIDGTDWDSALDGSWIVEVPLPSPADINLRSVEVNYLPERARVAAGDFAQGSNSWAVGSAASAHGGAIVANDMHLGHSVPNIWFRAQLRYDEITVTGATLPGVPGVVVGSNGAIAWSFTNSYGDYQDWIALDTEAENPDRYLLIDQSEPITIIEEVIEVARGSPETRLVRETRFGPILAEHPGGRALALRWTAHASGAVNLAMADMAYAQDVQDALAVGARAGMPAQNLIVVDQAGQLAWSIAGRLPQRSHAELLISSRDAPAAQYSWLPASEYPRVVNPPAQRLWSANARMLGGAGGDLIGNGGFTLASRARQIRDGLQMRAQHSEASFLDLQLDDRALFLQRWHTLLLQTLAEDQSALAATARELLESWTARAVPDDAGYRLVHNFRQRVLEAIGAGFLAAARANGAELDSLQQPQFEGPAWHLLTEQPPHLLSPAYPSWSALLTQCAVAMLRELDALPGGLPARTWAEQNTVEVRHPLSRAVPWLGRWLDMPAMALPGDLHMPRVQGTSFGASQRMAVSPGYEEQGYFHMPGGQSGHPLSPFFGSGHNDWARGTPSPFLPGPVQYRLTLSPTQ